MRSSRILFQAVVTIASWHAAPALALAAEAHGEGLSLVAGWFIRLGLALIGATVIVVGVLVALEGYAEEARLTPVESTPGGVTLVRERPLSYRRLGGGLLTVIVGTALLVAVVFFLPDKRTGRSALPPVIARLQAVQHRVKQRILHERRTADGDASTGAAAQGVRRGD